MCTNGANRLSGESDKDIESVKNDVFFCCLFNQFEPKKDAAAKRIEGFLSAVPTQKVEDNSLADVALKTLLVQYNTSLPTSAPVESLFSMDEDILKPKRSGLSDEHFEMLAFLKGN